MELMEISRKFPQRLRYNDDRLESGGVAGVLDTFSE